MKVHELKIAPKYYEAVKCGDKRFEIRLNDRDFKKGDIVVLKRWESDIGFDPRFNPIVRYITYITDFEQKPGFVVFGLSGRLQAYDKDL